MSYSPFPKAQEALPEQHPFPVVSSTKKRTILRQLLTTPTRSSGSIPKSPGNAEFQVSPPKDPILLYIIGAGKLATTPTRIRTPIEQDGNISPPRDPELLATFGAGRLATTPSQVRFALIDPSEGSEGESSPTSGCALA